MLHVYCITFKSYETTYFAKPYPRERGCGLRRYTSSRRPTYPNGYNGNGHVVTIRTSHSVFVSVSVDQQAA